MMTAHETTETERGALLALDAYLGEARELARLKREAQRKNRWIEANVVDDRYGRTIRDTATGRLTVASNNLWQHLTRYRNLGLLADILTDRDAGEEGGDAQ